MKIAVDATGGDYAPCIVVEAVAEALHKFPEYDLVLVGHTAKMAFYLEKYGISGHPRLTLVHAETNIEMCENSTVAVRNKKNSSITICAKMLRDCEVDAVVSAGHTGAAVAATKIIARTLPGVDRPALVTNMPARDGRFLLVDAGANTDTDPLNLVQFAVMGSVYAQLLYELESPRVALLSVGGEDCKGSELTKNAFAMMKGAPVNFVGNVEGNTAFEGKADVIVCDGFTGNVFLKCCEGFSKAIIYWLKNAIYRNPIRITGAVLARSAFSELRGKGDADEVGGAPLLGINGICIIGHGSSSPRAVVNAIKLAGTCLQFKLNEKIVHAIAAIRNERENTEDNGRES